MPGINTTSRGSTIYHGWYRNRPLIEVVCRCRLGILVRTHNTGTGFAQESETGIDNPKTWRMRVNSTDRTACFSLYVRHKFHIHRVILAAAG
jgi:hypothetical protein